MDPDTLPLGATPLDDDRCAFLVWAPHAERVEVRLLGPEGPDLKAEPLDRGYHGLVAEGAGPGARYLLVLDGDRALPDPASRSQPEGVHGPSEVVDRRTLPRGDAGWSGPPLDEHVLYELHVGTFSGAGTFEGVAGHLDQLAELGVTAIELMPISQFPGGRNWGYDGVFPFAPQSTYGGPVWLARLVDACHRRGLAVFVDVVPNHLGPEGNVLAAFGPYSTDRYATPWGAAINLDGPGSDEVRRYLTESALQWLEAYAIDGLRLDAIHAIVDPTGAPWLAELSAAVDALAARTGRRLHVVAETPENDARVVAPREEHGLGMHAVWSDDVHHAIHVLATGERHGYYEDYEGLADVATALRDGWVLQGRPSPCRGRRLGTPAGPIPGDRFVVFAQNHDQVGNRMLGERLSSLVDLETQKLVAALVLLSPFVPLLFMGEEYGETAPFRYFTSHGDPELVEAVRRGRREEFAAFAWQGEPADPQAEATFLASRLDHGLKAGGEHAALLAYHRELLRLRRGVPALARATKVGVEVTADEAAGTLLVRRREEGSEAVAAFNATEGPSSVVLPEGSWTLAIDSAEPRWHGPGDGPAAAGPEVVTGVVSLARRSAAAFVRGGAA